MRRSLRLCRPLRATLRAGLGASLGLALLAFLMQPGAASANVGFVRDPAQFSGPHPLAPSNLTVEHETLRIVCSSSAAGQAECRFRARYRIVNPGAETERAVIAFCGTRTTQVEVSLDGGRGARPLLVSERAELERRLTEVRGGPLRDDTRYTELGVDLVLASGERRDVVAEGVLEPGLVGVGSYARTASAARHAVLQAHRDPRPQRFEYFLAPIRTWHSVGPIDIEVRIPTRFASAPSLLGADGQPLALPLIAVREGDQRVMRARISAEAADALAVDVYPDQGGVHSGGPVLAVGAAFRAQSGFRMRAGWEVSGPDWLLYGLFADTNFTGLWVLAPIVEAASDFILILPSVGLGLGLPVRLGPEPSVGIRGQLSMMFAPVGLSFGVDVFPRDASPTQLTLLAQVSL